MKYWEKFILNDLELLVICDGEFFWKVKLKYCIIYFCNYFNFKERRNRIEF